MLPSMCKCESKVIGNRGRKKHEKKCSNARVSITMYRTVLISGVNGPTVFLIEGKTCWQQYTYKWLMKNGGAIGSAIIMTPTVFVTKEEWDQFTPHVCLGLRQSNPIIAANTQWCMLDLFYGFVPHTSFFNTMQHRFDNTIISLKDG